MVKYPKMAEADVQMAVLELEAWEQGLRTGRLTWAKLEKITGFSRQTLSKKEKIYDAYERAASALRGDTKPRPHLDDDFIRKKAAKLEEQLNHYKELESSWMERWVRIAYWARGKGFSIDDLDQPLPATNRK